MKIRIIKQTGMYLPQFRYFGFWNNFNELNSNNMVARNTLKQAEEWVNNYIDSIKYKYYYVIREYKIVGIVQNTGMK